ncbi:MAG: DUF1499 domain-containing protein [Phormidesmis sp. RL_2_1]|nr:DUF1499 domain-containing protein [Phormidesmis sp. RL_2_1]
MRSVFITLLSVIFAVLISCIAPAQANTLAVLPGLKGTFSGTRPTNIGVVDGKLAQCPPSPNCVVSQGADADHAIDPIPYRTDLATARAHLIDILSVVPRTKIVRQQENYILAESESRLMGFVDDSEFYFPVEEKVIHLRAAARLGESDLGVNRRRLEQIRLAFADLAQRDSAYSVSQP